MHTNKNTRRSELHCLMNIFPRLWTASHLSLCHTMWSVLITLMVFTQSVKSISQYDELRLNAPPVPLALEPLRWGAVSPAGWLRDWAEAARYGAGSPTNATFANIKAHDYPPFKIPPECQLSVDGWRHGRPCSLAFYDEVRKP